MTRNDLIGDENFIKNWRETLAKNATVQTVLQAMDESSPIYEDIPELAKESAEAKYWFTKGYTFYHKALREMAKLPNTPKQIKPSYVEQ